MQLLETRQALKETNDELQQERERNLDARFQIRNLQTLLTTGRKKERNREIELEQLKLAIAPQKEQFELEIYELKQKHSKLEAELAACTKTLEETALKAQMGDTSVSQVYIQCIDIYVYMLIYMYICLYTHTHTHTVY